jgi:tripartite-type tricarboxylate transporter receptor subunit TctC
MSEATGGFVRPVSQSIAGRRGRYSRTLFAVLVLLFASAPLSRAQTFPSQPVKLIVQTAAGASIDVAARVLAQNLSQRFGQQVYVLNQPGAGGAIAAKALAGAAPDGETLLLAASSIFIVLPEVKKEQAASVEAFVPIAFIGEQPMAIAVGRANEAKSLAELLEFARRAPGGPNCAVSTKGGLSHLTGEALREKAGIDLSFVHYPGTAQALTDVIAGRVPIVVDSLSALVGPAAGGEIRILAVASAARLPSFPDIPTVAETLPGFEATAWLALVAPPGTPRDLAGRIGHEADAVLDDPAFVAKLKETGTFVRRRPTSELSDFIASERAKWSPIVQRYGASQ